MNDIYIDIAGHDLGEVNGTKATHLRFSVLYWSPRKQYELSLTPCVKTEFGFQMNISCLAKDDNAYNMDFKLAKAARYNKKTLQAYYDKYLTVVLNLIEKNASAVAFECAINDIIISEMIAA